MSPVITTLHTFIETLPSNAHLMVGYSGGVDSHVLLHALLQLQKTTIKNYHLRAVHINHNLSPQAKKWQEHTQFVCQNLNVSYQAHAVMIKKSSRQSLEALARDARYDALAMCLPKDGFLLTAHHQQDQLETMLLQLCRGSGPKGLAAMGVMKPFAQGFHARPFLNVTRQDCVDYARKHQLSWVEDPSNDCVDFDRNYLRHEILPKFESRWPQIAPMATRSAEYCAQTMDLLDEYLDATLLTLRGSQPYTLSREKLLQFSLIKQSYLLRRFIAQQQLPPPTRSQLAEIQRMLSAKMDAQPIVQWEGAMARYYRDDLYLGLAAQFAPAPDGLTIHWVLENAIDLPHDLGRLTVQDIRKWGLPEAITQVELRFNAPGSTRIHLAGREHHSVLNKLWQDYGIPPWQRRRTPLLYVNNFLACIPGIGVARDY